MQNTNILVDSNILINYDRGEENAINWWEDMMEKGYKIWFSAISLMEMYRGLSKKEWIESFEKRINTMKKDGKLKTIIPINKKIAQKAQELLREYCLEYNPPQRRDRMQALIVTCS